MNKFDKDIQQFLMNSQSIEGWFTPAESLLARDLAANCKTGPIVEIGAWMGRSTFAWASGVRASNRGVKVVSVECDRKPEFAANMTRLGVAHHIKEINGKSIDIARDWPSEQKIEVVFIDGSHNYEDVRDDILAWYPLLRDGGIMALHDTAGWWSGPTRAMIEEIFMHFGKKFIARGGVDSLTYAVKTKEKCKLGYRIIPTAIIGEVD
jgi:hypothetical protein